MNHPSNEKSSVATKIKQAYWKAKRNFVNSLGEKDDDCLISNDLELDAKIEFLEAADNNFNALLKVLLQYDKALTNITKTEVNLSAALLQYGCKDATRAGQLMTISGRYLSKCVKKRAFLKAQIMKIYCEVETFQYKATVDVLQTVHRLEKRRSAYRSGLLWMKNESQNLDPDVSNKLSKFKKVQAHIKNLNVRFDRAKLETMQKIDLYLLSRCNLFSQNLGPYRYAFCKMSKSYASFTKLALQTTPYCSSYKFVILKQLNDYPSTVQVDMKHPFCLETGSGSLNEINPEMNHESRSNLVQRSLNSGLRQNPSKSNVRKKVQFHECIDSQPLETQSANSSSFSLLIDLDEGENRFKTNSEIETNQTVVKYSDDLLSINLKTSDSGRSFENIKEKGDFHAELGKCVNYIDSLVQQPGQEKTDELHFWYLMKNIEKSKDESSALSESRTSVSNQNLEPYSIELANANLTRKSPFHLEKVLMEFDPFVRNKNKSSIGAISKEDC